MAVKSDTIKVVDKNKEYLRNAVARTNSLYQAAAGTQMLSSSPVACLKSCKRATNRSDGRR